MKKDKGKMNTGSYSFKCSPDNPKDALIIKALSKSNCKNRTTFIKDCIIYYLKSDNAELIEKINSLQEKQDKIYEMLNNFQQNTAHTTVGSQNENVVTHEETGSESNVNEEKSDITAATDHVDDEESTELIKSITNCMNQFTNI